MSIGSTVLRPYRDIPGPRGLPVLGTLLAALPRAILQNRLHEYFKSRHKQYGPIYKEALGPYESVFIHDVEDIATLCRREGRYPRRTEFVAWKLHRNSTPHAPGLVLYEGTDWQRCRSAVNGPMLKTSVVASYTNSVRDVTDDMIARMRSQSRRYGEMLGLGDDLFRWSLEAGCSVMFGRRLGCLSDNRSPEIDDFIRAVASMFATTEKLLLIPPELAKRLQLRVWKDHCWAWDTLFRVGEEYIEAEMREAESSSSDGETPTGLIPTLLANPTISRKEICSNVIDLMVGAVDTTSNTMHWTLYFLSKNKTLQDKIREEVLRVGSRDQLTYHMLHQMPLVKAFIRETLRYVTVAPVLARVLDEDIVLGGYNIPAQTIINIPLCSINRDPTLFRDPDVFCPERWLRAAPHKIHPFSSLPFGFGPRSCVGRRVAELEMYMLLARVVEEFQVEPVIKQEIEPEMRVLLTPSTPARLRFTDLR